MHYLLLCLYVIQKAYVACNFICLFENEGLLKVICTWSHSKCGSILEMMNDGVVATTGHS